MTGPVNADQVEPLDPIAYKHQLLLLKSAHCCRPVVHQGLKQFINGLTLYHSGGRVAMIVYLAGNSEAIDSTAIRIWSEGTPTEPSRAGRQADRDDDNEHHAPERSGAARSRLFAESDL